MSDNGTSRSAPRRGALLCVVKGGGARGLRPTDRYGEPPVGDGVLDVPHETPPINVCRGRRPRRPVSAAVPRCKTPSGRGLSAQPTGGESVSHYISPSVSASRCHLPRRGRQGGDGLPRRRAPRSKYPWGAPRNDGERGDVGIAPYEIARDMCEQGGQGRPPLRSVFFGK